MVSCVYTGGSYCHLSRCLGLRTRATQSRMEPAKDHHTPYLHFIDRFLEIGAGQTSRPAPSTTLTCWYRIKPGPTLVFSVCKLQIKRIQQSVQCNTCLEWSHCSKCLNLRILGDWSAQFAASCCTPLFAETSPPVDIHSGEKK